MSQTDIRQQIAQRRIKEFERKFGRNTLHLAYHAALPVALNSELLHLLRINFFLDPPQSLPYMAEIDLLLSPLCQEIGEDLYEIDPPVRDELLKGLHIEYGDERLCEVAGLLWEYTERRAPWADDIRLERAQQLTALNFLEPEKAREWLQQAQKPVINTLSDEREWFVAMREKVEHVKSILRSDMIEEIVGLPRRVYVADMLITYAEYQLFLDEYLLKGERLHPDHWLQNIFPAEMGEKPVVGVRPSDAVEFCQWLTKRDKERWRYRLPYSGEFEPLTKLGAVGYWTDDKSSQEYDLENKPQVILPVAALENRLRADYTRAQQLDLDDTRDLALIRAVELARALDIERALAFDNDLARYLTLSLNPSFDRPLDLDNSLALSLDLDRDRNRVLALFLNEEHSPVLEMALDNALALDLSIALERALTRHVTDRPSAQEEAAFLRWYARFVAWLITEALLAILRQQQKRGFLVNILGPEPESEVQQLAEKYFQLYIDLAILEERLEGNLPAFEGIRVVKEWSEA